MTDFVAGFMFTPDRRQVALVEKNRPIWQAGLLNGIGGKIETFDASPVAALCREFDEEAGVQTQPDEWQQIATLDVIGLGTVYFFRAFSSKAHGMKAGTDEAVGLYDAHPLPENVIANLKWLIPLSLDENILFDAPIMLSEHAQKKTA